MARNFARAFYKSKEWQQVRQYVLLRDRGLCQKCGAPAEEIHHIVHLSPSNIWNVNVTLNPKNLVSLCRDCHFREHERDRFNSPLPDVEFDASGNPVTPP